MVILKIIGVRDLLRTPDSLEGTTYEDNVKVTPLNKQKGTEETFPKGRETAQLVKCLPLCEAGGFEVSLQPHLGSRYCRRGL